MKSVDERNIETQLRDAATERGATVNERANGHFQIRGLLLVNYWPYSKKRSAHVDGTTHGKHNIDPQQAVAMAFKAPPIADADHKDTRSGNSRRIRKRLIKRHGAHCHWCRAPITLSTSTVEHKIPLARGGLDNDNNRVLACEPCNTRRGHNMPELKNGFSQRDRVTELPAASDEVGGGGVRTDGCTRPEHEAPPLP